MKSPRKFVFVALTSAYLLCGSALPGQNPAPTPAPAPAKPAEGTQATPPSTPGQGQPRLSVTTQVVVVPVTVKDKAGNLVADLKKDEFRIFEDKVEQQVRTMQTETMPLSIVVLIDNDLRQKDMAQVEPSLVSIVGGLSASDEAYVARFDQFFYEGKGFTKDQDKLVTELRRTDLGSRPSYAPPGDPFGGPTLNGAPAPGAPQFNDPSMRAIKGQPTVALDDAVFAAAALLQDRDSKKRRKIILLISDGQNGAKFNTHKYDEVREDLLRQGITVYCVATGSAYFDRKFNRLVSYSRDTGGDIFFGAKEDSFSEFYSRITEEARNQYTLTYQPMGESKVDYHTIEVRVRREGLTILAREGYYGGTFAATPPK
jgi:VWFA-related protein